MRSGNHLVDAHEDMERLREESKRTCPECYGDGEKEITRDELIESFYADNVTAKQGLYIYHKWAVTGKVSCDNCEGEGYLYDF